MATTHRLPSHVIRWQVEQGCIFPWSRRVIVSVVLLLGTAILLVSCGSLEDVDFTPACHLASAGEYGIQVSLKGRTLGRVVPIWRVGRLAPRGHPLILSISLPVGGGHLAVLIWCPCILWPKMQHFGQERREATWEE